MLEAKFRLVAHWENIEVKERQGRRKRVFFTTPVICVSVSVASSAAAVILHPSWDTPHWTPFVFIPLAPVLHREMASKVIVASKIGSRHNNEPACSFLRINLCSKPASEEDKLIDSRIVVGCCCHWIDKNCFWNLVSPQRGYTTPNKYNSFVCPSQELLS